MDFGIIIRELIDRPVRDKICLLGLEIVGRIWILNNFVIILYNWAPSYGRRVKKLWNWYWPLWFHNNSHHLYLCWGPSASTNSKSGCYNDGRPWHWHLVIAGMVLWIKMIRDNVSWLYFEILDGVWISNNFVIILYKKKIGDRSCIN